MNASQPLHICFPIGTPVQAFHSQRMAMADGTVTGYLQDIPGSPYALVVTFHDSSRHHYYRAYIDVDNLARSLVVKRK